jgi:hypothetical protein
MHQPEMSAPGHLYSGGIRHWTEIQRGYTISNNTVSSRRRDTRLDVMIIWSVKQRIEDGTPKLQAKAGLWTSYPLARRWESTRPIYTCRVRRAETSPRRCWRESLLGSRSLPPRSSGTHRPLVHILLAVGKSGGRHYCRIIIFRVSLPISKKAFSLRLTWLVEGRYLSVRTKIRWQCICS